MDNPNIPLQGIALETATYGTNCTPYFATRCLVELATEDKSNYPLPADAILY